MSYLKPCPLCGGTNGGHYKTCPSYGGASAGSAELPKMPEPVENGLVDRISYDAATGILTWKKTLTPVGCSDECGYLTFGFMRRTLKTHRVAWFLHYGSWPRHFIDHINGDKADNRISNLRDVPNNLNMQNRCAPKRDNQSGFLGVVRVRRGNKKPWRAKIKVDNKWHSLGYYATPEEAHAAYMAKKMVLHPGYASAIDHLLPQSEKRHG